MANIRLKELIEANVDPKLVARSKESGKLVYFKTPDAKAAALKAGSHLDPKSEKGKNPKASTKPNDMFGGDYAKDRGGEASKGDKKLNKLLNKHGITKDLAQKASDEATKLAASVSKGKAPENINDGDGKDMVDSIKNAKLNMDETTKELTSKLQKSPYGKFVKDDKNDSMTFFFYDGSKYEMHIDRKNKSITTKNLGGEAPKDGTDWMDDLDSIDTSDIKGKADPNADSFTSNDLYGATFKDPETGKTITVGDAYEREDDSEAYKKAFAYVSKFDPDKEAVMGTQAYDDLQKKAAPKAQLPKKASELDYTHAETLEKSVNAEAGLKGYVDTDDNSDAIMYNASSGVNPTYTLYFGGNSDYNKPDEFRVSLLSTYGNDPSNIGDGSIDKTFKNGDDAMKFMIAVAKKYKKELEMDDEDTNESTKLTSMIKK